MNNSEDGTENASGFREALRAQLVAAADKRIRRRQQRRKIAVAAVWILVGVAGVTAVLSSTQPESAEAKVLTVTSDGPNRVVRLTTFAATLDEVRRELSDAGIGVEIESVPVAPASVGRFVTVDAQAAPEDFQPLGEEDGTSDGFRIRTGAELTLKLGLGRAAVGSEDYAVDSDAYREGNSLHCSGLWGKPAQEAITYGQSKGLRVTFQAPGEPNLLLDPARPSGVVTDALQQSADSVLVYLAPTAKSPLLQSASRGPTDCR